MNKLVHQNQHLLILFLDDIKVKLTINLSKNIYTIGRDSSCNIQLKSHTASRHHATLVKNKLPTGELFYVLIDGNLENKKSQNGTLVNGKKIISKRLHNNDVIVFGGIENRGIYKIGHHVTEDIEAHENIFPVVSYKNPSKSVNADREQLKDTLIILEENLQNNLNRKDINHLASFPELSPNPIVEFDVNNGCITYYNPAANLYFSQILQLKIDHNPLFDGLTTKDGRLNSDLLHREIEFEDKFYEQYIHYLAKQQVIRTYIFDITARKNTEAKLRYQAFHDSITGLPNRDFFYSQLRQQLKEKREAQESFSILFIDIDRFKNVNDTLSHHLGDQLLQYFGHRLTSLLPSGYFLARWGGDEFIVMTNPDSDQSGSDDTGEIDNYSNPENIAKMIIESLKEPFLIETHNIYISCSIGIATYPDDGLDEKKLIKHADVALSRAKQKGKNNYQFYLTQLNRDQTLLFKLEHSLYSALDNEELFLTFQPQLNLKTNKITGAEVLLRWESPDFGFISPNKFIPIAEETGLIVSIGKWVLETACRQSKKWHDMGYPLLKISVNVSTKQFQTENFIADVKNILEQAQFPPENLDLEITESLLIEDLEKSQFVINELSSVGVNFSLDDFGTGYSSLSYLKQLPFNFVKIDKSFVDEITFNPKDKALVSAVTIIAKSCEMKVIAEGVETSEQQKLLTSLDCDIIQGWLISKALKAKEFLHFLAENQ